MDLDNSGYSKRRFPTVAGIFYPDERTAAEQALVSLNASSSPTESGSAAALIVPHAGWDISGKVAAAAFRAALGRKVSTVVVIGPMHRQWPDGVFLSESEYFQTPIGDLAVDQTLCSELESCSTNFVVNDIPHLEEHSIEVVLPFIKYAFPSASIVPIIASGSKPALVRALARGLDYVFGPIQDSVLFVVSTNLCSNLETETAERHSEAFMDCLQNRDAQALIDGAAAGSLSACGTGACAALLSTEIISERRPVVVSQADSTGGPDHDPRKLVKYAGIAYF